MTERVLSEIGQSPWRRVDPPSIYPPMYNKKSHKSVIFHIFKDKLPVKPLS